MTLDSICQYDTYHVDFSSGLMAICGKNGSGKSTLLRALMYGLTGVVDGGWGTQKNLQRDGVATPGHVSVRLHDSANNRDLVIRRFSTGGIKFADSVTAISVEGADFKTEEVAVRRETVDNYLANVYGVPCSLLFQLCWGRQGQIDLLLTSPSAYISTFLSNIFNTKYLEQIRDKLKAQLDTITLISPSCKQQLETDETELRATRESLEQMRQRYTDELVPLKDRRKTALENLRKQYGAGLLTKAQWDAGVQKAKDAYDASNAYLEKLTAALQDRTFALYQPGEDEDISTMRNNIRMRSADLQHQMDDLNDKVHEASARTAAAADKLALLSNQKSANERAISEFQRSVDRTVEKMNEIPDVCDVCGAPITDKADYERRRCKMITNYDTPAEFQAYVVNTMKKYEDTLSAVVENIAKVTDERENCIRYGQEISAVIEDLRKQVVSLELDELLCEDWQKYYECHDKTAAAQEAMTEAISKPYLNQAMTDDLMKASKELAQAEADCSDAERAIAAAEARIDMLEKNVARTRPLVEKCDINEKARRRFQTMRDVLSQQRAQARYFATKIIDLNQRLARFMTEASMPFSLRLNEKTRLFEFITNDGYTHPASHLSGAQKNISAVALQMALVEVVQPNLNLFLFDEPGESLDVENKQIMSTMFQRMNTLLPAVGGTMLIVTRDEQLIGACENVLDVTEK